MPPPHQEDEERIEEEVEASPSAKPKRRSIIPAFMLKENIVAGDGFNRWLVPPASVSIHLCIGSVYAWSIFNAPLTREVGVVAAAASDWGLGSVVPIFSTAIVCLGLSAAVGGKWLEEVGPRAVGFVSACLWGGGFLVGSLGIMSHSLPLLYLGYGVLGGCGLGLGYVSPVSTLIRWFPDRRGMATGMAIMGFGGGAMIGAPIKEMLLRTYFRAPEYLGGVDDVALVTQAGRRFTEVGGQLKEVVVASAADLAALPVDDLAEGVYVVGTGSTGAASAFMTLGVAYFSVMAAGSFAYRVPAEHWKPAGWTPPAIEEGKADDMVTTKHVHIDTALKTPQFWALWTVLCFNVTAGIGVLGVAKTMMSDIFGSTLPDVVDGAFAASYVTAISVFNMGGRFFWASMSDYFGRKNTYYIFFGAQIPLYASIPYCAEQVGATHGTQYLVMFYGATMVIFSMYGGGFATIPAYLADIFGTKYVGGIHGRLLTAWSTAGVLGPLAITQLRKASVTSAIEKLATVVDPTDFEDKFGAPVSQLQALAEAKTVTIAKLMEIAPDGTVDPTPSLYNTTMYSMAGLLGAAALANWSVRPVAAKFHMSPDELAKDVQK